MCVKLNSLIDSVIEGLLCYVSVTARYYCTKTICPNFTCQFRNTKSHV